MTPMPHGLLIELKDIFSTRFSAEELADFALELGVDYEDLGGGTARAAKARALAQYIDRHGLLDRLLEAGERRRSEIAWRELYARYGVLAASPAGDPRPAASPADLRSIVAILAIRPMFLTPDGRRSLLVLAGVDGLVATDVNGNAQTVAATVVTGLNAYGRTADGDTALGRLVNYLLTDPTLPPDEAAALNAVLPRLT